MKRMGTIASMLAALALAGGLATGMAGTARADVIPPANSWAEIVTPYTNTHPVCLDDPSGSTAPGTPLQVFHCHGYASNGTPQRWYFSHFPEPGANFYGIRTSNSLCVGTNPDQLAGSRVMLVNCFYFGPDWNLLTLGITYPDFELELGYTGYCMTLPNWSGSNGEPVVLEPCNPGNLLQHWDLG